MLTRSRCGSTSRLLGGPACFPFQGIPDDPCTAPRHQRTASVLSSLDTKTLLPVADYAGGVRCKGAPLKPTFTPGEWQLHPPLGPVCVCLVYDVQKYTSKVHIMAAWPPAVTEILCSIKPSGTDSYHTFPTHPRWELCRERL